MKNRVKIHLYTLTPRGAPNSRTTGSARTGALLRVEFADEEIGYADCFPWPELGDAPLSAQLNSIKTGYLTPVTARSLYFASKDAQARLTDKSLFENLEIPPSHFLVTDLNSLHESNLHSASKLGFQRFKIKVGKSPEAEALQIRKLYSACRTADVQLRLDFNSIMTSDSLDLFLAGIGESVDIIDFLEDPIPFSAKKWALLEQKWKIKLALDRLPFENQAQILNQISDASISRIVIKPASQDPTPWMEAAKHSKIQVVFTRSLDHPLGQLCAAWCAATAFEKENSILDWAGLLSHTAYANHPWSDALSSEGPRLIPPSEAGFGLGSRLENLVWHKL